MKKFIRRAGQYAVDERCACGHPKSEHGSTVCCKGAVSIRMPGKGNCCCKVKGGRCKCPQFRWVGWIFSSLAV
jgi:hypothetical protein